MDEFRFSIDVPVRNQWSNIELLRSSVQSCLATVLTDLNGSDALAMATGELLENAVKYGDWSHQEARFRLRVFGDETHGTVSVENPIAPGDTGPERVREALRFIESFATAEEAYQARLLEIAARPKGSGRGLGLPRVAHEGGCRLSMTVEEGVLRVTAQLRISDPAAAR